MKPTDVVAPADTGEERGSLGAPLVKEEDPFGETLLILLPDRTQPPVDTSHVSREVGHTTTEEVSPGDSSANPQRPLWMPQSIEGKIKVEEPEEEEAVTDGRASPAGDNNTAEFARLRDSSLYQQPPLFMNTPQSFEGAIKKEEPEDVGSGIGGSIGGMEDEGSQMAKAQGAKETPAKNKHTSTRTAHKTLSQCEMCHSQVRNSLRQTHVYTFHLRVPRLFQCPLCHFSSAIDKQKIIEHLKRTHQEEFGRVMPISHEKQKEKEIMEMNKKCFPRWQRRSIGETEKGKRNSLAGGTTELEAEDDGEESVETEMGSDSPSGWNSDADWKRAAKKNWTLLAKILSKQKKTRTEGEEAMEEGEEWFSGNGFA